MSGRTRMACVCTTRGSICGCISLPGIVSRSRQGFPKSDLHCLWTIYFNPQSTELFNLNFQSLVVVSRYRDTQLQVTENVLICPNMYQCFKIEGIFYFLITGYQGLYRPVLIKTHNVYCSRDQCSMSYRTLYRAHCNTTTVICCTLHTGAMHTHIFSRYVDIVLVYIYLRKKLLHQELPRHQLFCAKTKCSNWSLHEK